MTLAEVKSLSGGRFPTERFGVDYDEQPTPVQMEKDALYYIYEKEAGVLLVFNHHEVMIQKKRIGVFGINLYKVIDRCRISPEKGL